MKIELQVPGNQLQLIFCNQVQVPVSIDFQKSVLYLYVIISAGFVQWFLFLGHLSNSGLLLWYIYMQDQCL